MISVPGLEVGLKRDFTDQDGLASRVSMLGAGLVFEESGRVRDAWVN